MIRQCPVFVFVFLTQFVNASSFPPERFALNGKTVREAFAVVDEEEFVGVLGVPSAIKWTKTSKVYTYVLFFSYERDPMSLQTNGAFRVATLVAEFADSKRVKCNVSRFLYVGHDLEISALEVAGKGIRLSYRNSCVAESR